MIDLQLSPSDLEEYLEALAMSRMMKLEVDILDRQEKVIASLTAQADDVVDGRVIVDIDQDVDRQLQLQVVDPDRELEWGTETGAKRNLFIDKFIAVRRLDWVPALDDWVACPVFWGPLSHFEREGELVTLEGLGKESLMLEPAFVYRPIVLRKGTKKRDAIMTLLRHLGETRFAFPDLSERMGKNLSVHRDANGWKVAQRLARKGLNRQLFYDGRGYAVLRAWPEQPTYTFRTGDAGNILSKVRVSYDMGKMRNTVDFTGYDPPGKGKKAVRAVAIAGKKSPFSPESLARNGKPFHIVEFIKNGDVRRVAQAKRIARTELNRRLLMAVDAAFDALPAPFLQENDVVAVDAPEFQGNIVIRQMTIPLTADEPMSIGTVDWERLGTKPYRVRGWQRGRRRGRTRR